MCGLEGFQNIKGAWQVLITVPDHAHRPARASPRSKCVEFSRSARARVFSLFLSATVCILSLQNITETTVQHTILLCNKKPGLEHDSALSPANHLHVIKTQRASGLTSVPYYSCLLTILQISPSFLPSFSNLATTIWRSMTYHSHWEILKRMPLNERRTPEVTGPHY